MENEELLIKTKKRRTKKIIGLFCVIFITLLILTTGTYAWFVGVGEVETSSFTISVSSDETFFLSLNGSDWVTDLKISKNNVLGTNTSLVSGEHNAYTGNTNHWPEDGLLPVSTSGQIDSTVSRLILYEKSSVTATAGGYRISASRINNYEDPEGTSAIPSEGDTYVTFDLFIKNGEDSYYSSTYDASANEALYLTRESSVIVTPSGTTTEDYGLANSVRVAFAQIGRVASTTTNTGTITSISCSSTGEVTGLCTDVVPTIWEPNNTNHNAHLISYFNSVCKKKTAATTYSSESCTALANNTSVQTYTIGNTISSTDNIDVYDGLNNYTPSSKLVAFDTFTDTEKNLLNDSRPSFISIASNSITKVRVYIYLEGQDVDNYDLISNGNTIDVNFGFTKDKYDLATTS